MIIDLIKKNIPEYNLKFPLSKSSFSFRPILVKEEKYLAITTNISSTFEDKLKNLCNLVNSCFDNKLDSLNMTIADFQYALNELRKKSIGDDVEFNITCPETKESIPIHLNLSKFKINKISNEAEIKLNKKGLLIKFKQPKMKDLLILKDFPSTDDDYTKLVASCIFEVETPIETYSVLENTLEEKLKYIEYLNLNEFKKIKEFIGSGSMTTILKYKTSDLVDRELEVNDFANFLKFYMVILTL
tara:strand:- start:1171 stop:1902 length:732 start_codon:yes stop_codon:yes gene_type:complete